MKSLVENYYGARPIGTAPPSGYGGMVDTYALGAYDASRAGSSPVTRTMYNAKVRDKQRADEKRATLREYLVSHGCVDCGYDKHYAALEFDHLPGNVKVNNVMAMCYHSWAVIWSEVEKCEVVCSNCHSIRTHERLVKRLVNGGTSDVRPEIRL